jgi:lambda family phage minor tail protein L
MINLFNNNNFEILELYEIKMDDTEGYFRFHGSKNFDRDIVFQGKTYLFIPCELGDVEYKTESKNSRPKFTVANINNYFSNLIKDRNNLLMKKLYRKKIMAKDLDNKNFEKIAADYQNPLGNSNFKDYLSVDFFIIRKKNYENSEKIEFELASPLDIEGQTVPKDKVQNYICPRRYRGCGCNYGSTEDRGPIVPQYLNSLQVGTVFSSSFFTAAVGNLGIPMADKDNKTFLKGVSSPFLKNNSSYNLEELVFQGNYLPTQEYTAGDFVIVDPFLNFDFDKATQELKTDSPFMMFVLVEGTSVINKHPFYNSIWVKDDCSRSIEGCHLRWGYRTKENPPKGLPFGGFPGTVSFEYDLPR